MKKTLFSIVIFFGVMTLSYSQIGILGTALNGYNAPDTDLIQTSATEFRLENQTFTAGTVKFRQNNDWATNWGSTGFPAGVAYQDGPEIPIPAGTYNIYFKITGLYDFMAHENIGIMGTAISATGFNGNDMKLHTSDGITFTITDYAFKTGELKFRKDNTWTTSWGSSSFPNGTGTNGGANIPVVAGIYTLTFNINTGEYRFIGTPSYPNIGILGTAVSANGYNDPDVNMATTDGVTYTLTNYTFAGGTIKFRQDDAWTTSWGGSNFPYGTAVLNSSNNIPVTAGTYTVAFNITNGSYTFVGNSFPSVGIWGPAVNSQLGYTAPDVNMSTTDGIIYNLSGFYFSSGNAYFRQDDNSATIWGSSTFPVGTATSSGPTIYIPSGEYFVTFNRITGEYNFDFPSIGILGTGLNGFNAEDTNLTTTDGVTYTISNLPILNGEVKFRKDNSWYENWGSTAFPSGTGTLNGANIPVTSGTYTITFDRITGNYTFINEALSTNSFNPSNFKAYPNPTKNYWNFSSPNDKIISVQIFDILGKSVYTKTANSNEEIISVSNLVKGTYVAKIVTTNGTKTVKLVKE